MESSSLLIGPASTQKREAVDLGPVREAIRTEHKLRVTYVDKQEAETSRVIWPIALGYFDRASVVVAWCELRQGFRHFRTDRLVAASPTRERYGRPRQALLREWRATEGGGGADS